MVIRLRSTLGVRRFKPELIRLSVSQKPILYIDYLDGSTFFLAFFPEFFRKIYYHNYTSCIEKRIALWRWFVPLKKSYNGQKGGPFIQGFDYQFCFDQRAIKQVVEKSTCYQMILKHFSFDLAGKKSLMPPCAIYLFQNRQRRGVWHL